jgi:hypothetical protein
MAWWKAMPMRKVRSGYTFPSNATVFFRPLPAAAAALRLIGAGLGRRRSAARGALISGLPRRWPS